MPLLAEEIQHPGTGHKGLMPGVRELLDALSVFPDAYLALLTGNYRDAAAIKLTHFEIFDYFEWGAFSDDSADRNALVPIARSRAETYDVPPVAVERVIVVGDTPHDIACARCAGARSIAVATGGYSMEDLRAAGADEVVADLSDTRSRDFAADMIRLRQGFGETGFGSERGPVALPVFKIGRCLLVGQAGFDSQALPPSTRQRFAFGELTRSWQATGPPGPRSFKSAASVRHPQPVRDIPLRLEQRESQRRAVAPTSDRHSTCRNGMRG